MKKFLVVMALSALQFGCAKSGGGSAGASSQVLPGTFDHQATGTYSATVSSLSGSQNMINEGYTFDFNESSGGTIDGRHNFQGIQSGFKKIAGNRSGNVINYTSTECSGDTFSGSFDLINGNGSFSGTICGYNFSSGSLFGMNQVK